MLLTRRELLDIIESQPKPLQSTLISLAWHASRFQPNTINEDHYGLCQITHEQAQRVAHSGDISSLLEPRVNIMLTASYLDQYGLVEFAGIHLAHELHSIISLALWLDSHGAPAQAAIDGRTNSSNSSKASATTAGASPPRFPSLGDLPRYIR